MVLPVATDAVSGTGRKLHPWCVEWQHEDAMLVLTYEGQLASLALNFGWSMMSDIMSSKGLRRLPDVSACMDVWCRALSATVTAELSSLFCKEIGGAAMSESLHAWQR
jgi:hypothetical protein